MSHLLHIRTDRRDVTVRADDGESLLDAIRRTGAALSAPCGGNGTCGKCRVSRNGETVLACRTPVREDSEIVFRETEKGAILTDFSGPATGSGSREASDEAARRANGTGREAAGGLGLAVDLGTTTVAAGLYDLGTGKRLGLTSAWNAQAPFGADVLSRCRYCMDHDDGTALLSGLIRSQIREMTEALGAEPGDVRETFLAGNTVMQHLYAGLSPVPIARAPFRPAVFFTGDEPKEEGVSYAPCVAGYVGGDITAGLLASGLGERKERSLFLDIGTNGEMAIGGADGFTACAVASGPAFEGAGISCGTAAVEGAVSRVQAGAGGLTFEVIGGGPMKGICGSGLIDLLAVLVKGGCVSGSGRLLGPREAPELFRNSLGEDENGNGIFYLSADRRVYLTAGDVRNLQLAKAAVRAGIEVLLKETALSAKDLDRLYLAGGFGTVLDVRTAALIGMIPEELIEKTVPLGNSSLAGAALALTDPEKRKELGWIRERIRYLELSGSAAFNEAFPEQMAFYEEEDDEWN